MKVEDVHYEDTHMKFTGYKIKAPHGSGRFFGFTKTPVVIHGVAKFMACILVRKCNADDRTPRVVVKQEFFDSMEEASSSAFSWFLKAKGVEAAELATPTRKIEYATIPGSIFQDAATVKSAPFEIVKEDERVPTVVAPISIGNDVGFEKTMINIIRHGWAVLKNAFTSHAATPSLAEPEGQIQ